MQLLLIVLMRPWLVQRRIVVARGITTVFDQPSNRRPAHAGNAGDLALRNPCGAKLLYQGALLRAGICQGIEGAIEVAIVAVHLLSPVPRAPILAKVDGAAATTAHTRDLTGSSAGGRNLRDQWISVRQ